MRRKLTSAMLLALSTASPLALALGVGEVEVRSSLNAPLRAVIPLTDTQGLDPERLRVSVAGPQEFESAGLSRTPLAASVRADVEVRQGRWVVTLSSENAVREPWMDLLLRFDWPAGRQLQEMTLLLDPPGYDSMPVLVSGSERKPASPAVETRVAESAPVASPVAVAPADGRRPAEESAWVGSGDTLWSVAGRLRPDSGISMDQMMVALVEANPDVFPSGNINAMRAGHTLDVPSREAIAARSAQEATNIVQAMNQAWASRGSGAPARVPLAPDAAVGDSVEVSATSAAATVQAVAETSTAPGRSQATEQDDVAGATAGEASAAPRLTLLSDEELAAEAAMGVARDGGRSAAAVEEKGEYAQDVLDAEVLATLGAGELAVGGSDPRLALLEQRWEESRAALEEVQRERDALQHELGGLRDEVEAMREQLSALLSEGASGEATGTSVVVQRETESDADASWWGAAYPVAIDRNLILGGAGLAALLGLWLFVRRRQRREAASTMGSRTMPNMVHGMPPADAVVPPNAPAEPLSPGIRGMSVSEAESSQEEVPRNIMPQAEAISEADIFMAYGRFDQARELLEAGLARDPERHDLRLKLLNVHVEQGERQAAEHEAQRLAETGDAALVAEAGRLLAKHQPPSPETDSLSSRSESPQPLAEPEVREQVEPQEHTSERDEPSASAEREHANFPSSTPADSGEARSDQQALREKAASPKATGVTPHKDDDEASTGTGAGHASPTRHSETLEWRTIDYQPPSLDPEPPAREETPMQPSVEFPRISAAGSAEQKAEAMDRPDDKADEAEWEVEEVAFPPLDRDNGAAPSEPDWRGELNEARRLLDAGEVERARAMLQRLRDGAEDSRLRDEAQALLTHNRL